MLSLQVLDKSKAIAHILQEVGSAWLLLPPVSCEHGGEM